jgi:ribose transport system permease protein
VNTVVRTLFRELRAVWMLLLVVLIIAPQSSVFLSRANLLNVLLAAAVTALLAAGQTFVIILAEIDLSVGAILGLSAVTTATALEHHSLPVALALGLAVGAGAGLVNGLLVTYARMPSFIATLGTLTVFASLTLSFTQGHPVSVNSETFLDIGQSRPFGVPTPVFIMLAAYLIFAGLLARSRYGRHVYATGDNSEASRLSGVRVKQVKILAFMVSGALAAVAGFILTARLGTAEPTAGAGLELEAIAAVIIGGTSLAGGRGNLVGTMIGALILGVIDNGLNLLDVSPFVQGVVRGAVILFAVFLDRNAGSIQQMLAPIFSQVRGLRAAPVTTK